MNATPRRPTAAGNAAWAYGLSLAVLAAVAYPASLPPTQDSYPLSTYPMFSRHKPREVQVASAVAVTEQAQELRLEPRYIANAEAMQAVVTLQKSLRAGPASARALCSKIATRIAEQADVTLSAAQEVALITRRVDSVAYLAGDRRELGRHVHARCPVPGRTR